MCCTHHTWIQCNTTSDVLTIKYECRCHVVFPRACCADLALWSQPKALLHYVLHTMNKFFPPAHLFVANVVGSGWLTSPSLPLLYLPGLLHGSNLPMNVQKTQPQRLVGMIAGACWLFFVPGRWWRPRFLRSTGQRIRSAKYSRRFMCYINHRVAPRTVLHGTCFITITDDCRR